MPAFSLTDLAAQFYDIGRAAIFRAPYWDGTTAFVESATHLGNTEGENAPEMNAEFTRLQLTENLGPGALKKYVAGFAPTFDLGLFMNPTLLPIVSPTGAASGGTKRQRRVREHTLWVAPEQLFIKESQSGIEEEVDVELVNGVWLKDSAPFTVEDQRLFDMSIFWWRVSFDGSLPVYRHEDAGKALQTIACEAMPDLTKPDGHLIWTVGFELAGSGIDLEGEGS